MLNGQESGIDSLDQSNLNCALLENLQNTSGNLLDNLAIVEKIDQRMQEAEGHELNLLQKIKSILENPNQLDQTEIAFLDRYLKDPIPQHIQFQTHNSYLNHQAQEIIDKYSFPKAANRVVFIRHGKTAANVKGQEQKTDIGLLKGQDKIFRQKGELIKKMGANADNSYLFRGNDSKRGIESAIPIQKVIYEDKIDLTKVSNQVAGCTSSDKAIESKPLRYSLPLTLTARTNIELMNRLKGKQGQFVIQVIHSSNNGIIKESFFDISIFSSHSKGIQNGQLYEVDLDINGKGINYSDHTDLLVLNDTNFEKIINELASLNIQDSLLNKTIQQFDNQKINIFELQNFLNAYFKDQYIKRTNYYQVLAESSNKDLKLFAVSNLIKLGSFENIHDQIDGLIKNKKYKKQLALTLINASALDQINIQEKLVNMLCFQITKNKNNPEQLDYFKSILESVLESILNKNSGGINYIAKIEAKLVQLGYEYACLFYHYLYNNNFINSIKNSSFDSRIRNSVEFDKKFVLNSAEHGKLLNLCKSEDGKFIKILDGQKGCGKSLLLSELLKQIENNSFQIEENGKKTNIMAVSLDLTGSQSLEKITKQIEEKFANFDKAKADNHKIGSYKKIVVLDSFNKTNISENEQYDLLKYLKNKLYHAIIGGFDLELEKLGENFEYLQMNNLSEKQCYRFINKYLSKDKSKKTKIKKFKKFFAEYGFLEMETNPQILSIVAEALNQGIDLDENMLKIFDLIAENMLQKSPANGEVLDEEDMDDRKGILEYLAYEMTINHKSYNSKDIDKLLKNGKLKEFRRGLKKNQKGETIKYDLNCLKFLHVPNNADGKIDFHHDASKEFWCAKYIYRKISQGEYDLTEFTNNQIFQISINIIGFLFMLLDKDHQDQILLILKQNINSYDQEQLAIVIPIISNFDNDFVLNYIQNNKTDHNLIFNLRYRGNPENKEFIIKKYLNLDNKDMFITLIHLLINYKGNKGIKILLEKFSLSSNPFVISNLIYALGEKNARKYSGYIKQQYSHHTDSSIVCEVIVALAKSKKPQNIQYIKDKYQDNTDPYVISKLILALDIHGTQKDKDRLQKKYGESDEYLIKETLKNI